MLEAGRLWGDRQGLPVRHGASLLRPLHHGAVCPVCVRAAGQGTAGRAGDQGPRGPLTNSLPPTPRPPRSEATTRRTASTLHPRAQGAAREPRPPGHSRGRGAARPGRTSGPKWARQGARESREKSPCRQASSRAQPRGGRRFPSPPGPARPHPPTPRPGLAGGLPLGERPLPLCAAAWRPRALPLPPSPASPRPRAPVRQEEPHADVAHGPPGSHAAPWRCPPVLPAWKRGRWLRGGWEGPPTGGRDARAPRSSLAAGRGLLNAGRSSQLYFCVSTSAPERARWPRRGDKAHARLSPAPATRHGRRVPRPRRKQDSAEPGPTHTEADHGGRLAGHSVPREGSGTGVSGATGTSRKPSCGSPGLNTNPHSLPHLSDEKAFVQRP